MGRKDEQIVAVIRELRAEFEARGMHFRVSGLNQLLQRLADRNLMPLGAPMTDDPINLAEVRAMTSDDGRLWTPLDALRAAIRRIESGELKPQMLFIAMREPDGDKTHAYRYIAAGCSNIEACGLLAIQLAMQTKDTD